MERESEAGGKKRGSRILTVISIVAVIGVCFIFIIRPWEKAKTGSGDTDVDLTAMSGTMVYSYVYDMLYTRPDAYIGKTVKAKGQCVKVYYEKTGKYYYFVVIKDAAACCSQGLEFTYEGGSFGEDKEIEVTGTFEKYEEFGIIYYYLNVSSLIPA